MSTQRRVYRSTPATETCRRGPRYRWRRTNCTVRVDFHGIAFPDPNAQHGYSFASGGTAPPGLPVSFHPSDEDLSPGTPARLATNSLQLGYRIVQLVRRIVCHGSPPFRAGLGAATGTRTTHGSSPPLIPSPAGHARFHPALPRVPTG